MPRSTTVWAAALVLASFSGSGSVVTTAEAMPAPGPSQTQGRPRYYFPRHIKRQIDTNVTAPAVPASSSASSSSSSSSEKLESRQFPDFMSFVFGGGQDTSSSQPSSSEQDIRKSDLDPASTLTSTREIIVTTTPELPAGTGNVLPAPVAPSPNPSTPEDPEPPVSPPSNARPDTSSDISDAIISSPVPTPVPETPSQAPQETPVPQQPAFAPTGSLPASPVQPSPEPSPEPVVEPEPLLSLAPLPSVLSSILGPEVVEPSSSAPVNDPVAPTGEFPQLVIPSSTPAVAPTGELPSPAPSSVPVAASPEPSAPADENLGGLLSSLLVPVAAPTGAPQPSEVLQPTPAPVESVEPTPAPEASSFLGPFIVPGSSEAPVPVSSSEPLLDLPSLLAPLQPSPTGAVGTGDVSVPIVLPTSAPAVSEPQPILSLPASGIVIGITTALGTGDVPTPTAPAVISDAIPTSETGPASSGLLNLPPVLPSLLSEIPGVLPSSGLLGPTAPVPTPSAEPSGILSPIGSSVVPDLPSLLSSIVSDVPPSAVPSGVLPSDTIPSGILPSAGVVPTGAVSSGLLPSIVPSSEPLPIPSETPFPAPSFVPSLTSGILPSGSGVVPTGSIGTSVSPAPTPQPSESFSVPASEQPPSPTASDVLSSPTLTPPTSGNATLSDGPTAAPSASIRPSQSDSATLSIPTIATTTSKPPAVVSISATATDSATSLVIGTSIVMEPSTASTPVATSSGIPSSLPKMIAPPGGMPPELPKDSFMGQVCFKWPLNYPFVSANDGGKQIFHYLPQAIADGLDIPVSEVKNMGLKPLDTTAYQGFITTLALFTIPSDLQDKLAIKLRNPVDKFWRNNDTTINDLTSQINTACPLPAGGADNSAPNESSDPASTSEGGGSGDGGAIGGDIGASRKVNSTSAIVASSAIVGAFAYGAAMFFVARRYRNKRIAHQRASSVPSTSRMTYGSIPGGAAAWMHGARNGRMTPGSRGSRGSDSSQGRSVRTQQISAPVMAENSLGWN